MEVLDELPTTPFALEVPEILQHIFEVSDGPSNCKNVVVCKAWSSVCLKVLWREVTCLNRIAKLLGPTSVNYSDVYFSFESEPLRWSTFNAYARLIRKISHDCTQRKSYRSVMNIIALSRPLTPLLPNLETLEWHHGASALQKNYATLFLQSSVKRFILREEDPGNGALSLVLRTAAERCPYLEHISISLAFPRDDLANVVLDFIKKLPHLTSVVLPPFTDLSPFILALPNLTMLTIQGCRGKAGRYDKPSIEILRPATLEAGWFSSLTRLNVVVPYSFLEGLFVDSVELPCLTEIRAYSDLRKPETPSVIRRLLDAVVKTCPDVTTVRLSYKHLTEEKRSRFPPSSCIVQMDHIRSILRCFRMRDFKLKHPFPLALDDNDAEIIASTWPNLRTLHLGCDPVIRRKDPRNYFTLRALVAFARHCPLIESLSLLLFAQPSTAPFTSEIEDLPSLFFCNLRTLNVGASKISDKGDIAMMMCLLLPESCVLKLKDKFTDSAWAADREKWVSVKDRLPYVRVMYNKVSDKLQKLETENLQLRKQLGTLSASCSGV